MSGFLGYKAIQNDTVFMSDIADEGSQQINARKGYKSVVLEDVT